MHPFFVQKCVVFFTQVCDYVVHEEHIMEYRTKKGNWAESQLLTAAAKSLQSRPTLCDPIDGSPPGSPVPGILQARSGLPRPSPGDLPHPGIKPRSPALAGRFFTTEPPGEPHIHDIYLILSKLINVNKLLLLLPTFQRTNPNLQRSTDHRCEPSQNVCTLPPSGGSE